MIQPKIQEELEIMKKSGRDLGRILKKLVEDVTPGTTLLSIDREAEKMVRDAGGTPSFQTVDGYKWTTCLCVNEAVVHGIPTKYAVKDGDILTIDIGMLRDGMHVDTAWSFEVGHDQSNGHKPGSDAACDAKQSFLDIGAQTLTKAIAQAKVGNRVGHVSQVIQAEIERHGYSVVKSLVGHGIGTTLHEEPQIPGFLRGSVQDSPLFQNGLTIAIEIIYAVGKGTVVYDRGDGWTIATKDQSLSAVFEHTIAITQNGPLVLTDGNI